MKRGGTSLARTVVASLALVSVATAGGFVLSRGGEELPPQVKAATFPASPATRPAAATAVSGSGAAAASPASRVPKPAPMSAEYEGLLKRSLFSKSSRRSADPDSAEAASHTPARKPEADLVLRGVSLQDGQFTALVEDVQAKRVRPLHLGDTVGRGRLCKVGFDGVEYECAGEVILVSIGDDLTGALSAVAVEDSSQRSARSGASSGSSDGKKRSRPPTATSSVQGQPVEEPGSTGKGGDRNKDEGNFKGKGNGDAYSKGDGYSKGDVGSKIKGGDNNSGGKVDGSGKRDGRDGRDGRGGDDDNNDDKDRVIRMKLKEASAN